MFGDSPSGMAVLKMVRTENEPFVSMLKSSQRTKMIGEGRRIPGTRRSVCHLPHTGRHYSRGRPSPRVAMTVRWISLVPPSIVFATVRRNPN